MRGMRRLVKEDSRERRQFGGGGSELERERADEEV